MRLPALLFLFFLFFSFFTLSGGEICRLRVIQTTDIHGEYNSFRNPGCAKLAAVIRKAQREVPAGSSLYIDCGDLYQGTYESASDQGLAMTGFLNLLRCDVYVPGNHDLDFGPEILFRNLKCFHGNLLACNLSFSGENAPELSKYAVFQRGGMKIAVIGMSPRYLSGWFSGPQLRGIRNLSPMKEFSRIIPRIMKEDPDLIILAMHEGEYKSPLKEGGSEKGFLSRLFRSWPQIRIVLGGHTHMSSSGKKCYRGQWYVQAPALSEGAAVIDIAFDSEKKEIVSLSSRIRPAKDAAEDPEIRKLFEGVNRACGISGKEVIGTLPFAPCPMGKTVRSVKGNPLAGLFGKALREKTKAPVAFHGTMSNDSCDAGRITARRLFLLAPYENVICTIPLTPEECRSVIEEQYRNVRFGYFQAVSGIRFRMKQGRISGPLLTEDGKEWLSGDKETAFTVYALSGAGGRFPVLAGIGRNRKDRIRYYDGGVRKALEQYIRNHYSK